jgi:MFS family permease
MTQAIKSFRSEADTSMASSDDVIRRHPSRVIIPLSIGNALEWFDIVIYGYLAVTISRVFFPAQNELNGLLIVLATFGASFAMRPIGSIVLGAYADASGRKKALNLSIILMMVGTLAIAVAPTYAQAGVTGSIMIVGAKLVQGFSAGGEYGSATALLAEQDEKRRGFYASWQVASQGMTVLLAAFFGYVLNSAFTPAQLDTWAWRIPFVFGLSVGPVALYIRRNLAESQEFSASIEKAPPVFASIAEHRGRIIASLGILVIATTAAYTVRAYNGDATWRCRDSAWHYSRVFASGGPSKCCSSHRCRSLHCCRPFRLRRSVTCSNGRPLPGEAARPRSINELQPRRGDFRGLRAIHFAMAHQSHGNGYRTRVSSPVLCNSQCCQPRLCSPLRATRRTGRSQKALSTPAAIFNWVRDNAIYQSIRAARSPSRSGAARNTCIYGQEKRACR